MNKKRIFAALIAASLVTATSARETRALRWTGWKIKPAVNPLGHIVLVHGFLETGSSFTVMKKHLERRGYHCLVPKLRPSDGRGGLESVAAGLKHDIDTELGRDRKISIIAFSMGGLVSRYYLQNLGGASRCERLITISSPHLGTRAAWLYPSKGAEQMRPGSQFLQELSKTEHTIQHIPKVSYRTPLDLVILPPRNSVWDAADNLEFPVLLHPLMLSSRKVITDIEQRLLEHGTREFREVTQLTSGQQT